MEELCDIINVVTKYPLHIFPLTLQDTASTLVHTLLHGESPSSDIRDKEVELTLFLSSLKASKQTKPTTTAEILLRPRQVDHKVKALAAQA